MQERGKVIVGRAVPMQAGAIGHRVHWVDRPDRDWGYAESRLSEVIDQLGLREGEEMEIAVTVRPKAKRRCGICTCDQFTNTDYYGESQSGWCEVFRSPRQAGEECMAVQERGRDRVMRVINEANRRITAATKRKAACEVLLKEGGSTDGGEA